MMHDMPTLNPRITVTLTPAVSAVLKEMSRLTKNSQSALVAELLETSLPVFERMCTVLRAAETVGEAARSEISAGLGRAQARVEEQIGLQLSAMDEVATPLLDAAERINRRGAAGARTGGSTRAEPIPETPSKAPRKGISTPVSNRGVTPTPSTRKTTAKPVRRRPA
jgi:hypothetical protein